MLPILFSKSSAGNMLYHSAKSSVFNKLYIQYMLSFIEIFFDVEIKMLIYVAIFAKITLTDMCTYIYYFIYFYVDKQLKNTFPSYRWFQRHLQLTTVGNILAKGEIAHNEQLPHLPQYFQQLYPINILSFIYIVPILLPIFFQSHLLEICCMRERHTEIIERIFPLFYDYSQIVEVT